MESLPQEFLVLSRQLGQAQLRCSASLAAQAAQIESLQTEVIRLRAAVIVRDTRLAIARDELASLRKEAPDLPRRGALARQVALLAERIAALSRERLRWGLMAHPGPATADIVAPEASAPVPRAPVAGQNLAASAAATPTGAALAAANLVICQTGCLSHHDYWRVQDHCRRMGTTCVLVEHSLAALQAQVLDALAPRSSLSVLSLSDRPGPELVRTDADADGGGDENPACRSPTMPK